MLVIAFTISFVLSATSLTITEPTDGETYDGDWLTVRAIVENSNMLPDSVCYSLNGSLIVPVPRLNTDWYTYMQNDLHNGYSESPAPLDNTIFWTAPVTGTEHEFPTPVVVDGLVYYPQNVGGDTLFALDAATGEVEWIFTGIGSTDDAVTVKDGRLYVASDSIYCLNALTGMKVWSFGKADQDGGTPVVSDGKVYCARYPINTNTSWVYCLEADTGSEIWEQNLYGQTGSCMTYWNGVVLVPTHRAVGPEDGSLYALSGETGDIIWQNEDEAVGYWDSSPNIVDGIIYIGGEYLRAIDANSGETIWAAIFNSITATPAYHTGNIYVGDTGFTDSQFTSVNSLTGVFNWMQDYRIHGSPGIADGMVFFGEYSFNDSARVIALDCATGDTVWTYMTTANRFHGSPSIVDGVMYIPAIDGNLYAFGTGLKYTYLDDLYAQVGSNELIVTSFDAGLEVAADTISFTVSGTGINLEPSYVLNLLANPNPFISTVSISFEISEQGFTSIQIFDLAGRTVTRLVNGEFVAGEHTISWNGMNQNGESVSSGLYICRIESGGVVETTGLCLLK